MKTIKLTKNEARALEFLLTDGEPCSKGCPYEEMICSDKDCNECKFNDAVYSILEKLK